MGKRLLKRSWVSKLFFNKVLKGILLFSMFLPFFLPNILNAHDNIAVHPYVAEQAFYVWPNDTSHEIKKYLGLGLRGIDCNNEPICLNVMCNNSKKDGKWITEGAIEEDFFDPIEEKCNIDITIPLGLGYHHHFYNPDINSLENGLCNDLGAAAYAYTANVNYWKSAKDSYLAGIQAKNIGDSDLEKAKKGMAYWYLGRIAHLLVDASVPAHVHIDPHLPLNGDSYEQYMASNSNYMNWTSKDTPPLASLPSYWTVADLFWNLAQRTQYFPSDDKKGNTNNADAAWFTGWPSNPDAMRVGLLCAGISLTICEIDDPPTFCHIEQNDLFEIGKRLMPLAIQYTSRLYELFWKETHPILSLSKIGNGQVRVNGTLQSLPWSGEFDLGTQVQLEAVPDTGGIFSNWAGDFIGNTNPTTITMDGSKNVIANFGAEIDQWAKTFGGSYADYMKSIRQTSDGGYIVVGKTYSFGQQKGDMWIVKLNADGDILWQKTYYPGTQNVNATSIQLTSDNGFIVSGYIEVVNKRDDAWVVKLDSNGNIQWQKSYGGSYTDLYNSIQQTLDGGYIVSGITDSFGAGNRDAWVVKLDSNGNIQWQKTYGSDNWDTVYSIYKVSGGGYILVGQTHSFGGGFPNTFNMWILRIDSNGDIQWQKIYGSNWNSVNNIQQTADNGFIVSGTKAAGIGQHDIVLIKLDSNGNIQWQKAYGGTYYEDSAYVQQTTDGGYILGGLSKSFPMNDLSYWIAKLNSTGNIEWEKIYKTPYQLINDPTPLISQTFDGGYILAGQTNSFGAGQSDLWILKLDPTGNIGTSCNLIETPNAIVLETTINPVTSNAIIKTSSASVTSTAATPQNSIAANTAPLCLNCTEPEIPILINPYNGAPSVSTSPTLEWNDVMAASSYDIQVCSNSICSSIVRSYNVSSSQWIVSPALSQGITYYWRVRANNSCGTGPWSSILSFTTATNCTDSYEPNGSSTQAYGPLNSGSNYSGKICLSSDIDWFKVNVSSAGTISLSLTVPSSNDHDLELYNPSGNYVKGSYNGTGATETLNYNASTIGIYYIRIYGYNGAYNTTSSYTLSYNFTNGDTTPPIGSIIINGNANYTNSASVSLTLSASDTSGISQMCISNTTSCTSWADYATSKSWILSAGDGTKTVYVWFKDGVGNDNKTPADDDSIILDTTSPSNPTSVNSPSHTTNTWSNDRTVDINWSGASDSTSGVDGYSYTWDNSQSTVPDTTLDTTGNNVTSPSLSDGNNHYFHIRTKDKAGNWNSGAVHKGPFYIDGTVPADGTLNAIAGNTQVSLNWSGFSDNGGSGLKSANTYKVMRNIGTYPNAQCTNGTQVYLGSNNSTTDTGLTNETTYYYRACAYDNAGNISTGVIANAKPQATDTTAPPAPINLSATPSNWTNTNSFSINWTNPSDPSSIVGAYYKIGSVPTSNTDGTYTTSKPFTVAATAQGGQNIYLWLKDGAGNTSYLNRSSTTLYYDGTVPTNGTLTGTSGNAQVSLSWSGFSDSGGSDLKSANTYKVVRNTATYPNSQCTNGTQVYLGTGSSAMDTGLTNGTTYYYRACAYDNAGNVSTGATANATPLCLPPSTPSLVSPSNPTIGVSVAPTLDWNDASGATSYKVQVCSDSSCLSIVASATASNSQWTVSPALSPTMTYYWRVKAKNSCGSSAWSEVWKFKTKPTLTVVSPNGSPNVENWQVGTTQTINWTYTGKPGQYVKIELFKGGILNRTITPGTPIGSNGSGSYNWTIKSKQTPGSDYRLKITSTTNSNVKDKSDGNFTISQQ